MAKVKEKEFSAEVTAGTSEESVMPPLGINPKARQVKVTLAQALEYQEKGKLAGHDDAKGLAWIIPAIVLGLSVLFGGNAFAAVESTDESVSGNARWRITNAGHFVPVTDSSYAIGASGAEVSAIYADAITIGGGSGSVITTTLATNAVDVANSVWGVSNGIVLEGATANAFETTISPVDPTADQTISIPNNAAASALMTSALTTNAVDAANAVTGASNGVLFEGATADGFEMTLSPGDPGADVTITIPASTAAAGVMLTSLTTNGVDVANSVTGTSNGFIAEGATADGFETTVSFADPGADFTLTIPASTAAAAPMLTALTTNAVDVANAVTGISNGILFEGATADAFETTLSPVDPTADQTVSIPNVAVNSALVISTLTTNNVDAANSAWGVSNGIVFEGATANDFETTVAPTDVTADATITLPTKSGTLHGSGAVVALTPGATPTLTVVAGRQVFTYQPADNTDATFNASGAGSAGDEMVFIFTTDAAGSGDEVMTFGTNMYSTGTLTMANLASDIYVVSFVSNGTAWVETARTAVQTT